MSYYAEISFKKMKSQDVISFLKDFKCAYIKKIPEIAKENYPFCPARGESFVKCDVITCAAPNFATASNIYNVSKEENTSVLESRIKFILYVAAAQQVDTLILGAFGSGVFGQDATEVAEITMKLLKRYNGVFKKVVFAVIDEKSTNYKAFNDVIGTIQSVKEL